MFNKCRLPEQKSEEKAYPSPELLTLTADQAAMLLQVSRPTMYELMKQKDFPSFTIGRKILINRKKLQSWLDAQCGNSLCDSVVPGHEN